MRNISKSLSKAVVRWSNIWKVPELAAKVSFTRNSRLKTTIARWLKDTHCIELGSQFFVLRKRQGEILCHELAHAAAIQLHGRGTAPHGPEWSSLVKAAGFAPGSSLKMPRLRQRPARQRPTSLLYEHRCPVCHAVRYAKRGMIQWRCIECVKSGLSGRLQISLLGGRE